MADENLAIFTGLHVIGQFSQCTQETLENEGAFTVLIQELITEHELKSLGSVSHSFEPDGGFTSVVCLSESHISVHTWPELQYATLDVFLCNYSRNNDERCRQIFKSIADYFAPTKVTSQEIKR